MIKIRSFYFKVQNKLKIVNLSRVSYSYYVVTLLAQNPNISHIKNIGVL